ncbi:hypothetical protein EBB07_31715 [Paenibacillaceae bacterium]|nr:hypothetical protein EBB07_31715 [Paenibacillaceae bacterium]
MIKKQIGTIVTIGIISLLLSGCLYPKENLAQSKVSVREDVTTVQTVIERFQKEAGLLPIKNSSPETSRYEKYIVDLAKLQRMNYISVLPSAAFEQGGRYFFLILNEETAPIVKVQDVVLSQAIIQVQNWVDEYRRMNKDGDLLAGEQAYPGFYHLDYNKLGQKEPTLRSPFSGLTLATLIDDTGIVYIDYGIDVMKAVEKLGDKQPSSDQDLRELLVEFSDYVPVKSPVYHWVDGEPRAVH